MQRLLGIETKLQLAITLCVLCLIAVTTLGGSGGAPWVFLTYRTLLVAIAVLGAIGSRKSDFRISGTFLGCMVLLFGLMWISLIRIRGSHFEAYYLWFKYAFFAAAFLNLAHYARLQSARWKGFILASILGVSLAHLLPDLIINRGLLAGFSKNNANYFATFLLIGLAISIAAAAFGAADKWRMAAAGCGAVMLFGIVKTSSRGGTLAAAVMIAVAAVRARGRIPRQVWMAVGLAGILAAVIASPLLVGKFLDRGEVDPYSYARTTIWRTSLGVISQNPILGVGFGQFYHVSKRFTLPVEGTVARYLKRAQMAHNEYLQHIAELGTPAALLLFGLLAYLLYGTWKRARTVWPEFRPYNEAALFIAAGVGTHALVDNCWTIPVTASALVTLALADPLPLTKREAAYPWSKPQVAFAAAALGIVYVFSIAIPGIGLYYNDRGHQAYDRDEFASAERDHLAAIRIVPNHPLFLDNLGMVYLQQAVQNNDPRMLAAAKDYFRQAMQANPHALDPHVHMEGALARSLTGDPAHDRLVYEEMIETDSALLTVDPFVPFARKNLATAYYNLGRFDEAMRELQKAIEYEPNYIPGYLQMAAWFRERGEMDANQRYTAAAINIVNKYRNFKVTSPYEGILLGRPEETWAARR